MKMSGMPSQQSPQKPQSPLLHNKRKRSRKERKKSSIQLPQLILKVNFLFLLPLLPKLTSFIVEEDLPSSKTARKKVVVPTPKKTQAPQLSPPPSQQKKKVKEGKEEIEYLVATIDPEGKFYFFSSLSFLN